MAVNQLVSMAMTFLTAKREFYRRHLSLSGRGHWLLQYPPAAAASRLLCIAQMVAKTKLFEVDFAVISYVLLAITTIISTDASSWRR